MQGDIAGKLHENIDVLTRMDSSSQPRMVDYMNAWVRLAQQEAGNILPLLCSFNFDLIKWSKKNHFGLTSMFEASTMDIHGPYIQVAEWCWGV